MLPYASFELPDGTRTTLVPGGIIGRMDGAALHIDDVRISEAHAMLSLRGGELKLLALRGRFSLGDKPLSELVLKLNQRVLFARDLALTVVDLSLPETVFALEGPGLARHILGGVSSLRLKPRPRVIGRYDADADAWFYSSGGGWRMHMPGEDVRPLTAGDVSIAGQTWRVLEVPLEVASHERTRVAGGVASALQIVANYDTVHVLRDGHPALVLNGRQARVVSELATIGAPCGWDALAPTLWPDAEDRNHMRRKWDITLAKLRSKLRAHGVRGDLIQADGKGNFELVLNAGDEVRDNT